jgi:hypothetical protein
MRVVGGNLGYDQRTDNAERTDRTHDCPYSCDPIKGLGGPKLSGREFALCRLLILFAVMYFSDQGLERRPFVQRHLACWFLAVAGRCVHFLAVAPLLLPSLRLWKSPGHCC